MIGRLRKIGNSTGILLSKSLLDQCDIKDEVDIHVENGTIVIEAVKKHPREGWEQQFINAGSLEDKENILGDFENKFDEEEWQW